MCYKLAALTLIFALSQSIQANIGCQNTGTNTTTLNSASSDDITRVALTCVTNSELSMAQLLSLIPNRSLLNYLKSRACYTDN